MEGMFRALNNRNYRLWAGGAAVSNIGTWMQRTAQDWLVLAELTNHNATAMGIVMALQFGPAVLLLPLTGYAADRCDRRKLVFVTQTLMAVLALGLGVLTLSGYVQTWHVYVFALLLGCVTAFDSPARQTFVGDLVGEQDLANAVGLNSTSFNAARMIGPAVAGGLIAVIGTGWVFAINALSFLPPLVALLRIRPELLHRERRAAGGRGQLLEGFVYVWRRPDLKVALAMMALIGMFGLNFPIFISTMSLDVFHGDASQYGWLSSTMALGSVTGALLAARRARSSIALLAKAAAMFGLAGVVAATMPHYALFALVLVAVGVAAQTFTTSTNSLVQISTEPAMRGRVVAIMLAIAMGGTPLGAPLVGWLTDTFGPRWALAAGASSGLFAAALGGWFLHRHPRRAARSIDDSAVIVQISSSKGKS